MLVKSTREGLPGQETASGWHIDPYVPFVALPSRNALWKCVSIRNPLNGRQCQAIVLDVGPWNIADDAYVFGGNRPAAERGESVSGQGTNGAGIDLGGYVWYELRMADNTDVDWRFLT